MRKSKSFTNIMKAVKRWDGETDKMKVSWLAAG
jgi:hypothetical protein